MQSLHLCCVYWIEIDALSSGEAQTDSSDWMTSPGSASRYVTLHFLWFTCVMIYCFNNYVCFKNHRELRSLWVLLWLSSLQLISSWFNWYYSFYAIGVCRGVCVWGVPAWPVLMWPRLSSHADLVWPFVMWSEKPRHIIVENWYFELLYWYHELFLYELFN